MITDETIARSSTETIKNVKVEVMILSAIRESIEPIGAVTLGLQLGQDFEISQATIGRKLKEFDMRGLTVRVGYQGRQLTPKGEEYLKESMTSVVVAQRGISFLHTLNGRDEVKLIQVLEARRALEREITRLAALRIQDKDVEELDRLLDSQRRALEQGEPGTYQNLAFHEAITRFADNEVLTHALYLVRNQSDLTLVIGLIRQDVGGVLLQDHQRIVHAIRSRDPERAARAMELHMDRIIEDVRKYFRHVRRPHHGRSTDAFTQELPSPFEETSRFRDRDRV